MSGNSFLNLWLLNNFTRLQPWKELITTWGHSPVKATCRAGAPELTARARSEQQLSLRSTLPQLPSSNLFVVLLDAILPALCFITRTEQSVFGLRNVSPRHKEHLPKDRELVYSVPDATTTRKWTSTWLWGSRSGSC